MASSKLFTPLTLGGKNPIELEHRVVMAPLGRLRAGGDGAPKPIAAEYYSQRATQGGLIIAEATDVSAKGRGFWGCAGLYTAEQVAGWKRVTDAIHAKGGKTFVQIFHTGRVGHSLNLPEGEVPVTSTAGEMEGVKSSAITPEGRKHYTPARALELHEIPQIVESFKIAATNAIAAGFDGVEIHAANGYLLEQFLCDSVNHRTDNYGGSIANRARLTLEVVEALVNELGSRRVAIRLSPFAVTYACTDSTPAETYGYLVDKLNQFDLAYLHLIEPRGEHPPGPHVPKQGVTRFFRPIYKGVILTASGYDRDQAVNVVDTGIADCVAFGRPFISTPDLVHRLKIGAQPNAWDRKTFYWTAGLPLDVGYTDYPFLQQP